MQHETLGKKKEATIVLRKPESARKIRMTNGLKKRKKKEKQKD